MGSLLLDRVTLRTPSGLAWAILVLVLVTAGASAMSLAPATSWLGQGAQEYTSFLSLVGFVTMFFLGAAFLRTARNRTTTLLTMTTAAALVGVLSVIAFLRIDIGIWRNVVGTPHALAIYLLVSSLMAGTTLMVQQIPSVVLTAVQARIMQVATAVLFVTTLLVLVAIDSNMLWGVTLAGLGLLAGMVFVYADDFRSPARLAPFMALGMLALVLLLLPSPIPSPFLQEASPNFMSSWSIATGGWREGNAALGTGPGTFAINYSRHITLDINGSPFWDTIFDRGFSHALTVLATTGILGFLAWLTVLLFALRTLARPISLKHETWLQALPVGVALFTLSVAAFVYAQSFVLVFTFWLLLAFAVALTVRPQPGPLLATQTTRATYATVFVAMLVFVMSAAVLFVTLSRYAAEVTFAKAARASLEASTAEDYDSVIARMDRAAGQNGWNDMYYRNLAVALLNRLSVLTPEESADAEYVQSVIKAALTASEHATSVSPNNVLNWDVRGLIYTQLLPIVPDSAEPAVAAYTRAIALAPANPRYHVALARTYSAVANAQTPYLENDDKAVAAEAKLKQEQAFAKSKEHLKLAQALKPDYAPATYDLALLLAREGNLVEAVRGLEQVKIQNPNDVGVGYQLGLLYLHQGKNEQAQVEFERVLLLQPAFANAHWYLSVIYEQRNNLPEAIREVEAILKTNPDDTIVQQRLDRLRQGTVETTIPDPLAIPSV